MAYQRWNPDTRNLFQHVVVNEVPETWTGMDNDERNYVKGMFDFGFVRKRIPTSVRVQARNEFFDEMDIDPADFDWNAWRRYMGYDEDTD